MVEVTGLAWVAVTSAGRDITADVALSATYYAQRVKLVWTNSGSQAAYIRQCDIAGRSLEGGRTREVSAAVAVDDAFWADRFGRSRSVRNNVYIQTESQAQTVANYLLARSQRPQVTIQVTGLDDPDVRIGRKVTVDYTGMISGALQRSGVVVATTWTLNSNGFKQDATVLDMTDLFTGCAPFFVLGTNKLGTGTGSANLFY